MEGGLCGRGQRAPGSSRIRGLPLGGPPPRLVLLEGVGAGLDAPQGPAVADVHLLRGHLLTASPLEARATHTGVGAAAGASVLAGRLAVSWRGERGEREAQRGAG